MAVAIPSFMLSTRGGPLLKEQLTKFFVCEERGLDPNNPGLCDKFRDSFREFSYPELSAAAIFLINLFPVMFLVYIVDFEELKMKLQARKKRFDSQSHSEIRSTQVTTSTFEAKLETKI